VEQEGDQLLSQAKAYHTLDSISPVTAVLAQVFCAFAATQEEDTQYLLLSPPAHVGVVLEAVGAVDVEQTSNFH
jgi:hypothetical protein